MSSPNTYVKPYKNIHSGNSNFSLKKLEAENCCSVTKSCVTDSWWPHGLQHARLPALHHLLKDVHILAHWVCEVVQPSHSPPPSSPFAFHPSQHQDLVQWVISLYQVAQMLELQHQSFQLENKTKEFNISVFQPANCLYKLESTQEIIAPWARASRESKKQKLTIQTFEWSDIEHKIFLKILKRDLNIKK